MECKQTDIRTEKAMNLVRAARPSICNRDRQKIMNAIWGAVYDALHATAPADAIERDSIN